MFLWIGKIVRACTLHISCQLQVCVDCAAYCDNHLRVPQSESIWMESQVHWSAGYAEGNVLGPHPEVVTPFSARRCWSKRKVLLLFKHGLQMLHSQRERVLWAGFVCIHFFMIVVLWIFDSHPSIFPFATSNPIVSIQLAWLVGNNARSKLSFYLPCHQHCVLCWQNVGTCQEGIR